MKVKIVRQLAIFLENKPGALLRFSQDLAERSINILAMSVMDSIDHSVVRMVLDKPMEAIHLLGEAGVLVVENDLLAVPMTNKPGELVRLCQKISELGVNIEYAYGSSSPESSDFSLYLRVFNPEKVLEKLTLPN